MYLSALTRIDAKIYGSILIDAYLRLPTSTSVMITDEETDTVYVSTLLKQRYPELYQSITFVLKAAKAPLIDLEFTMDIWCRDYMPIQVSANQFVLFKYNPDYLKPKKFHNLRTEQNRAIAPLPFNITISDLVIDGGNVVRHTRKAILTDKIFKENEPLSKPEITDQLKSILDLSEIIIIPKAPSDFTGHSDGMVRFVNEQTVLLNDFSKYNLAYSRKLEKSLRDQGLDIILLPWDGWKNKTDQEDTGDYINFLHVGNLIIVPDSVQKLIPWPRKSSNLHSQKQSSWV